MPVVDRKFEASVLVCLALYFVFFYNRIV